MDKKRNLYLKIDSFNNAARELEASEIIAEANGFSWAEETEHRTRIFNEAFESVSESQINWRDAVIAAESHRRQAERFRKRAKSLKKIAAWLYPR